MYSFGNFWLSCHTVAQVPSRFFFSTDCPKGEWKKYSFVWCTSSGFVVGTFHSNTRFPIVNSNLIIKVSELMRFFWNISVAIAAEQKFSTFLKVNPDIKHAFELLFRASKAKIKVWMTLHLWSLIYHNCKKFFFYHKCRKCLKIVITFLEFDIVSSNLVAMSEHGRHTSDQTFTL